MGLGRLTETAALVLISLADGPKHGTAILQDIAATSGRAVAVGTLYGTLDKLIADGLVEPREATGRRRPYAVTADGSGALAEYLAGMTSVVSVGIRRLALG